MRIFEKPRACVSAILASIMLTTGSENLFTTCSQTICGVLEHIAATSAPAAFKILILFLRISQIGLHDESQKQK